MASQQIEESNEMFRPPIVRSASAVLDRALFSKTYPIAAARVPDKKLISKSRGMLEKSKDLLRLERVTSVREDPDPELAKAGAKCLLLKPEVKADDPTTWSSILKQAVEAKELSLLPYELTLDYNYWTYLDIMKSILPEDSQGEIPVGFAIVGHVAHLNLRDQYLPYKHLIAEVLVDKNPVINTVINKVDDVGEASEYRTFSYEVLAGDGNMNVEIKEEDCTFRFDYSKVYWNSRLSTEHSRLVSMFNPGEVVSDVMAGVGPFAIPAGKKGVFVWANDLNPDSYASMVDAVERNKVSNYVRPFNIDGHKFIHEAADELLSLAASGKNTISIPSKRPPRSSNLPNPPPTIINIPQTISHYVMNLPATALTFLPSFVGLYAGHESLFQPHTRVSLPYVHVHCFSTKSEDHTKEGLEITDIISKMLGMEMRLREGEVGKVDRRDLEKLAENEVVVQDVRDVAPLKRMFCASFRLPAEVAFRKQE